MHATSTAGHHTIRSRELSPFAAGLLAIGSTAAAIFVGLLLTAGLLAAAALVAAKTLMDLV